MKKLFGLFAVGAASIALTSCGDTSVDKITVALPEGDYYTFFENNVVQEFENETGVEVQLVTDKEIETAIAAGDIPNVYTGGFGARGARYAKAGLLRSVDSFDGYDELAAKIDDSYMTKVGGSNYYIPWNVTTTMMIYNKDFFDAAGVDYSNIDNWTFEDFLAACVKLDAAKGTTITTDGFYPTNFWNEALAWGGWYWDMLAPIYYNMNGGEYQLLNDYGTDVVFDKPEAKMLETFEFIDEANQYAPAVMEENGFFEGKSAMWLQFGYGWKTNLDGNPDLSIDDNVGIAPVPVANAGDTSYSTLGGNGLVVFKTSAEEEELSWKLIEMLMEEELNLKACTDLGQLPTLTSLQGHEAFSDALSSPFVEQSTHAILPENYAEADIAANYVLQAMQKSIIAGSMTHEAAIAEAASKTRADLAGSSSRRA